VKTADTFTPTAPAPVVIVPTVVFMPVWMYPEGMVPRWPYDDGWDCSDSWEG
jgi:hypothetical protein